LEKMSSLNIEYHDSVEYFGFDVLEQSSIKASSNNASKELTGEL